MTDFNNPFEIQTGAPKSPIKKYISWQGSEGYWKYRQKQEDGSNITMSLGENIFIVPMVIFNCVSGWNSQLEVGVRSNEVLHLGKELAVFAGGSEIARGNWKDIKNKVVAMDGNFTIRMYAMLMEKGKDSEMVVLDLSRSSLIPFYELKQKAQAGDLLKLGKNATAQKNGGVTYFIPTIENKGQKEQTKADAMKLWPPVAQYLNQREQFAETETAVTEEVAKSANIPTAPAMDLSNAPQPSSDNDIDDLPF